MPLAIIGMSLIVFAVALLWNARRAVVDRRQAWIAVSFDLGWVVFSAAVLLAE